MLIALVIVSVMLAASLVANIGLFVGRVEWKKSAALWEDDAESWKRDSREQERKAEAAVGCIQELTAELFAANEHIDELADELAFAELMIEEWEDDYDALQAGALDAMEDLAEAGDAIDCALGHLAGALDRGDDEDECEECGLRICRRDED